MCDAAAAVTSIRKQEAAAMLGNRADFHLGDAVIVAVLSVLLVMLMTDGFFVSIQIYFHSCQRKKKNTLSTSLPGTNSLNRNNPLTCRSNGSALKIYG